MFGKLVKKNICELQKGWKIYFLNYHKIHVKVSFNFVIQCTNVSP